MHRGIALGVGLVAMLVLAGCAPAVPTAHPTPTFSNTHEATPRATPTPTQPALADLVVSPEGIGPLRIDQPVPPQSGATAVVTWDANACSQNDPTDYRGAWLANYPKTGEVEISNPDRAVFTFTTEHKDSPVTFVAIWSRALKTDKGMGLGSTAAQLTATYGSALAVDHEQLSDLYSLQGTDGTLVFEVPTAAVAPLNVWSASDVGSVVWMYVFAGHDAATSLAANQAAGSCFVHE